MKEQQIMNLEQRKKLLDKGLVGNLATVDSNGTPYVTPIHYIYYKEKIYIHGATKGKKVENILNNSNVCFTAFDMASLIVKNGGNACNVNTDYESVIVKGKAIILEDFEAKKEILEAFITKYTPQLKEREMPNKAIEATCVIEISMEDVTGKFNK